MAGIKFNRDAIPPSAPPKGRALAAYAEMHRVIDAVRRANLPRDEAATTIREASYGLSILDRAWRWWCLKPLLKEHVEAPDVFWPLFLKWWDDGEANLTRGWDRSLATASRFGRAVEYMEPKDREWLASLPERVTIYRGQAAERRAGISWTTDREIAEWFGRRQALLGREAALLTSLVWRSDIIAAFSGETEVLILPRHVRDRREERIPDDDNARPSAGEKTP